MLIKYIVPEDGDEQTHPNVFSVVSVQAPSLGQVRKAFPLPGTYHFRMLRTVNNMTVWMDAVDDSMALSAFEGTIFLKASRVGENSLRQQQQLAPSSSATANVTGQQSQQRSSSSGSSGSGPAPSRSNLLQFSGDDNDHHHGSSSASASFLETDTNDLIGLNSPEPVSSSSSSSSLPKVSLIVVLLFFHPICRLLTCFLNVVCHPAVVGQQPRSLRHRLAAAHGGREARASRDGDAQRGSATARGWDRYAPAPLHGHEWHDGTAAATAASGTSGHGCRRNDEQHSTHGHDGYACRCPGRGGDAVRRLQRYATCPNATATQPTAEPTKILDVFFL